MNAILNNNKCQTSRKRLVFSAGNNTEALLYVLAVLNKACLYSRVCVPFVPDDEHDSND